MVNNVTTIQTDAAKAINELHILTERLEQEFLTVGKNLQNYAETSMKISQISQDEAGYLIGENNLGAILKIVAKIDNIINFYKYCKNDILEKKDILNNIKDIIQKLNTPLFQFQKTIKRLHFIGISTKIENAYLRDHTDKFSNLVESVKSLSKNVEQNSDNIIKKSDYLSKLIIEKRSTIIINQEKRFDHTYTILSGIQEKLDTIQIRLVNSSHVQNDIANKSNDISNKIGKMIISLQFQDIIKQKFQKLQQAFNEFIVLTKEQPNGGNAAVIEKINKVYSQQLVEINSMKQEMNTALDGIKSNMTTMISGAKQIALKAQGIVDSSIKDDQKLFTSLKENVAIIISLFGQNVQATISFNQSIGVINTAIKQMDDFLNDINNTGGEIELVAYNGLVNAVHLGNDGRPLSVLADELKHLSVLARNQISEITSILRNITTENKNLQRDDDDQSSVNDILESVTVELQGFVDSIETVSKNTINNASEIANISVKYAQDVESVLSDITIQTAFNEAFTNVSAAIQKMGHNLNLSEVKCEQPQPQLQYEEEDDIELF